MASTLTVDKIKGVHQGQHDQHGPAITDARGEGVLWRHSAFTAAGVVSRIMTACAVYRIGVLALPHAK